MKLEDQVISLELSKKLKELGIKQKSLFYYGSFENPLSGIFSEKDVEYWSLDYDPNFKLGFDWTYSAFTSSELLETLPKIIHKTDKNDELYVKIYKVSYGSHDNLYVLELNEDGGYNADYTVFNSEDKNLSNACAKMLIYLIENKLMEIK